MRNHVIILAKPDDIHAVTVAAEVGATFQGRPVILDTARYPTDWRLTLRLSSDREPSWALCTRDLAISSDDVAGVWWRRPDAHRISKEVKDRRARRFCLDEARAAFLGWIHGLGRRVVNPLAAEAAAMQKPLQLLKAKEIGLAIPDTLVTNDPEEARRFVDMRHDAVIFKTLTAASWQFVETRQYKAEYRDELDKVRYAPVIFQELVPALADIRVTIVDEKAFAVSIKPEHPGAQLDWRLDAAATIEPHQLPQEIEATLIDLVSELGLRFGAIDLRLTPRGNYVFLEINPAGQFLFCEIHARQPISRALAASLLHGPPAASRHAASDKGRGAALEDAKYAIRQEIG